MRIWGFDALRYLPSGWTVAFGLLVGLLVLALVTARGRALLDRGAGAWGRAIGSAVDSGWRRRVGDLLVPLLLLALCWALRARYALLGDNWLRLEQAMRGQMLPYEWGTMALAHAAMRLGASAGGLAPRASLAALNTLAAIPFGLAAARLARVLGRDARERGLVHLGLLGLGGVQLFCGYIEVYSWAFAVLALYLASAHRALEGGSLLVTAALFAVAVALHAIALPFALPLLVLVAWRRGLRLEPGDRPRLDSPSGRAMALGMVAVLAGALALPLLVPALFYPYTASAGRLSLLAPALWWERVNAFVLASPAGALLGLPLLAGVVIAVVSGRARLERHAWLVLSAALPVTLSLWEVKAILGAADWDILAFAGLPLLLWAAVAARPRVTEEAWPTKRWSLVLSPLFSALIVLSLLNTWGFVMVNAGDASIRRVQDLIGDDPAPYYVDHPPPLHLAFLFESNDLHREMYAALEDGVRLYPDDPRMAHNLASACFRDGELEQAKWWAREAVVKRPGYLPPIHLLFLIAERERNTQEIVAVGEILLQILAVEPELAARYLRPEELAHVREVVARLGPGARAPDAPTAAPPGGAER